MLVCSDSQKREIVGGVKIPDGAPSLGSELLDLTSILDCGSIVQSGTDRDT